MKEKRYIVGIDLGTTNSSLAYFDTKNPNKGISLFSIPQEGSMGVRESLHHLPSFCYLKDSGPLVGAHAKDLGALTPTRLVHSAKSWLSNSLVGRKERILPLDSYDSSKNLSPLEATALYLTHLRERWNEQIAKGEVTHLLEEQEVIVTVPASFDEVARELTLEAAQVAGLPHLTLLEEPTAAFYAWLLEHERDLQHHLDSKSLILVCDIGGGTTDFSLIEWKGEGGFIRQAVGRHLLLGGDNMDRALAHHLEHNREIDHKMWQQLVHGARTAKEYLLSGPTEATTSLWLAGTGSSVVGGGVKVEVSASQVKEVLLDGFFGLYPWEEALKLHANTALHQGGLPFEAEPSITKQLAHFLSRSGIEKKPTHVLFNGGTCKPHVFQERILASLDNWFGGEKTALLHTSSLDFAVSMGATYFGRARRGEGTHVQTGSARSYYLGIEVRDQGGDVEKRGLTLLPRNALEETTLTSTHRFTLTTNQPVQFELYSSHTRLGDTPGDVVELTEEEMHTLPPLQTVLSYGAQEEVEVALTTHLTPLGTLDLTLDSSSKSWKLLFQVRSCQNEEVITAEAIHDETLGEGELDAAKETLKETFAVGHHEKLKQIMPLLEKVIEKPRQKWSPSVLRGLFEPLLSLAEKRELSHAYAAKFWNMAGYLLRPGKGYPLDDWRMKELWKIILGDHQKQLHEEVELQQWICYRRVAAGLSKGQQHHLFSALFTPLYQKKKQELHVPKKKGNYVYAEKLRTLASFELVDISHKQKLAEALLKRLAKGEGEPFEYWALGRIGARELLHGSLPHTVPAALCEKWVYTLLDMPAHDSEHFPFMLAMLCRKTAVRELNLGANIMKKVESVLGADVDLLERELTFKEQERLFGDSLPTALTMEIDQ